MGKKNHQKVLVVLLVCSSVLLVNCDENISEKISVVASAVLRTDVPYKFAVTNHNLDAQDKVISVGIEGTSFSGKHFNVTKEVSVAPGQTTIGELELANLTSGNFKLFAFSEDFSKWASLYVNNQEVSILIQVNKPIFRQDDLVKFRVFFLDSQTLPYSVKTKSKVWILDPHNNEVKVWKNPIVVKGLFEASLKLVDFDPGTWKILVEADGEFVSKSFEVRRDKRPIFELELSTSDRSVPYRDGCIKFKVKVKVLVKSSVIGSSGFTGILNSVVGQNGVDIFSGSSRIEDSAHLEIDFKNDLKLMEMSNSQSFILRADFIHDVTNKTFSASSSFNVEMSDFIIGMIHSPLYFKPGIPYSFTILVTKVNGLPVLNSQSPIDISVKDNSDNILILGSYQLDPYSGTVRIEASEISNSTSMLIIRAKYDRVKYLKNIELTPSTADKFLSINVLTPRPRIHLPVELQLISTASVPKVIFQLFTKGLLEVSRVEELIEGKANFSITPMFSYVPKVHCIAFFIDDDGSIISDSLTLSVEVAWPNIVNLSLNSTLVEPGNDFSLNVRSTLNSSVSLMAIDQRILLSGYSIDISKDIILKNELLKYDKFLLENIYGVEILPWLYFETYQKKFIEVGAVILTNALQNSSCKLIGADEPATSTTASSSEISTSSTILPLTHQIYDINKKFYDSFLFKTIDILSSVEENDIEGAELINVTAPELAKSWIITGIAVSDTYGLGFMTSPAVLNTGLMFYIDFIVPFSIKVGEIVQLEMLVVNLFDHTVSARVEFFNKNGEFTIMRAAAYNWVPSDDGITQNIWVQRRSIYRLRIEIRVECMGLIDLRVSASSAQAGDTAEKQLLVVPEGFPAFENHAEFVILEGCEDEEKQFKLAIHPQLGALLESIKVQTSISGDVLGQTLRNLESLIRLPSGCGEQTMINFVPIVVVLDYLTLTEQLTASLAETAIGYLESAYEKMLKYRHSDGSFSAFGDADKNGSTWLTAYVVRYFRGAQRYIFIDERVIGDAVQFINTKQESSGKFREDGIIFHKSLQSGTGSGIAFTSYVTNVIHSELKRYPQHSTNVLRGINYVKRNYDPEDPYSLALVTYLLLKTDDSSKEMLLTQFLPKASRASNYVFWKNRPASSSTSSLDIEITAYGLLIIELIPSIYSDGFKALNWLVSQQNSRGGFQSTQDTVIALEAIVKFNVKIWSAKSDLTVEILPDNDDVITSSINSTTKLITQKYLLEDAVREVTVVTKGRGFVIVQLSCSYFIEQITHDPQFDISVRFDDKSCDNKLVMHIWARYRSNESNDTASNMAVMKIEFPSGFKYDADTELAPDIQKLEELSGGSAVNVYFNSISVAGTCFQLVLLRHIRVYQLASSNIEVFDFYDTSAKASITYKPPTGLPRCFNKTEIATPPIEEFTTTEEYPSKWSVTHKTKPHPRPSSSAPRSSSMLSSSGSSESLFSESPSTASSPASIETGTSSSHESSTGQFSYYFPSEESSGWVESKTESSESGSSSSSNDFSDSLHASSESQDASSDPLESSSGGQEESGNFENSIELSTSSSNGKSEVESFGNLSELSSSSSIQDESESIIRFMLPFSSEEEVESESSIDHISIDQSISEEPLSNVNSDSNATQSSSDILSELISPNPEQPSSSEVQADQQSLIDSSQHSDLSSEHSSEPIFQQATSEHEDLEASLSSETTSSPSPSQPESSSLHVEPY